MRTEKEVLSQLDEWARGNDLVRVAILTGSRAGPKGRIDFLSDYDISLYVTELSPFQQDDTWLSTFGAIMICWPLKPRSTFGDKWLTRLVLFKDGVRIDFQITDMKQIPPDAYDNGYRVLIDKDALTKNINPPTFDEFTIRKPTRQEFELLVHEFWWDASYVAKYLWRDQLPFVKYMLDNVLRYSYLQPMVEWHIGQQHNWSVTAGLHGKWFKHYLDPKTWSALESTYAASDINDNWTAFFNMLALFRKLAGEIGKRLGYEYPVDLDANMTKYFSNIRAHKKAVGSCSQDDFCI